MLWLKMPILPGPSVLRFRLHGSMPQSSSDGSREVNRQQPATPGVRSWSLGLGASGLEEARVHCRVSAASFQLP